MHHAVLFLVLSLSLSTTQDAAPEADPRDAYDVLTYDLEFAVEPETRTLEGVVTVRARVLADELPTVLLDLAAAMEVLGCTDGEGRALEWRHEVDALACDLSSPVARDGEFAVRIHYRGQPSAKRGGFSGFHWAETADGRPWINTSCQGPGAHSWWPCKASYFNPDDKPEGTTTKLTVPADLYGVSNGRLISERKGKPKWFKPSGGRWKTYSWEHPYPLETYTVTLNVAPYVVVEQMLKMPGVDKKVPFIYYVLPENEEKAAVQFEQVPRMIEIFSEAFGPWPFPDSKFGLVETNFWGMEHSTAVAYGSSYPAWCKKTGARDPYARRNRFFDYILIHESAHEWWGNAVSTNDWGHFWIHEGFGTYAEGVYVEFTEGRERADEYFRTQRNGAMHPSGRLWRGDDPESGDAYSGVIYSKGAVVLDTLRHFLADDEVWWQSLRDFNLTHRYGNANTEDFQKVLEKNSGRSWERFFAEWFYGKGAPATSGTVAASDGAVSIAVEVEGEFHLPLDLAWSDGTGEVTRRVWLEPGANELALECDGEPRDLRLEHLARVLGKHKIEVETGSGE
ncbi:MAG: M1 family metallopeptidase [Planctomycetota bacterium]|nr:M1 family metallopeptidase [Planctomycetota bacterium]